MKWFMGLLLILGGCVYSIKDGYRVCDRYETVESIGGCDQFGRCAVRFASGVYSNVRYPVIGKTDCTVSHWVSGR